MYKPPVWCPKCGSATEKTVTPTGIHYRCLGCGKEFTREGEKR